MRNVKVLVILAFLSSSLFGFKDMLNRNVNIESSEKLIFVGPGALRLGVYMGLTDRIVGIERTEKRGLKFAPYRGVVKKKNLLQKPIIGEGGPGKLPSMEALINSGATLIIASFIDKEQAKLIEQKTKIPVFIVSYGSGYGGDMEKLASIKKSLTLLGDIADRQKRAKELKDWMDKEEQKLKNLKLNKKSLYVGGIGYKGSWGLESTESNYLPFSLLGLKNSIGTDKEGHIFLDLERILELNPDIIFLDEGGSVKIKEQKVKQSAIFDSLKAFKNRDNYWVPPFNFYNTNVENSYLIAWMVAEKMGIDVDLEKKKKEIFDIFLNIDDELQ